MLAPLAVGAMCASPLSVSGAQDLMDIMFDQSFPVAKQDLPISLSVENVIFVMEDVDATSPIVRARESAGNDTCKPAQPQQNPIRARKVRHVTHPASNRHCRD